MLLKISIEMCAILCWMRWGWQCGVNMHHHDLAIIIVLQTHPAKLVSSWCMAPTLWCKDLLFLLRKVQTSSAHSCPSDTHLLNLASPQLRKYFSSWSWYKRGISRIQPARAFFEMCCWKEFYHQSHGFSAHMLTVYQSPVLYAWTMLSGHLVGFSPIHVCWCLHFSELLAGVLSSSKTLKPLQLVHHSMPILSPLAFINVRLPACHRCHRDWLIYCLHRFGQIILDFLSLLSY